MSQHGQFQGYPDAGPPGHPQQYSQPPTAPPTAPPQTPYLAPGQYPVHGYYPQQQHHQQPVAPEPARPRRALKILIPLCVVLALAFGGSAYFFFFSGDAPSEVVGEYITRAQDEDFAGARDLTASTASKGSRFEGNKEDMETSRRWFGKDSMSWQVREESTSGSESIVTVDKTFTLPNYDDPLDMRWDYRLKRESGAWKIEGIKLMSIVEDGMAAPGDCLLASGLAYSPTECAPATGSGTIVFTVTDAVDDPKDCPNPKGPAAETTKHEILCLEELNPGTA